MEESRIKKAQKNIMMAAAEKILFLFLSFITRMIFVRVLSASYLGINSLFSDVLNILTLADLGMWTAMMYSLYKPLAEHDEGKILSLVGYFRKIYLTIAVVILSLGLLLLPFLRYIVRLEAPVPHLEAYYILILLNVVISYLFVYRTALVQADQKSYILSLCTMVFRAITFVLQVIVLLMWKNYFVYLLIGLITGFLGNAFQNTVALKMYPYLKKKPVLLEQSEKGRIKRDVKATFIYRVAGTIQSNTDNLLISVMVGTVYVGYYSNYILVINAIISIITMIYGALKASVGNLVASEETGAEGSMFLFDVLELMNFWLVGFSTVCFVCLFQDFIKIAFANQNGMEYVLPFSVVLIMVCNFYTGNIRQTIWVFREATGLFHEVRYVTAVTAVLNVFFSLLLGWYWGMFGIIVATVLSRMLYAWWKEPMVLYQKCFHTNPKIYYITYLKRVFLCAVSCGLTYFLCGMVLCRNEIVGFIIKILICCAIPNVIFLLYFQKSKEFQYLWDVAVVPAFSKIVKKKRNE